MFHSALNAPWLLIVLYLLPLVACWCMLWARIEYMRRSEMWGAILAALLLGAGLALLGAAYLHDVWYC